MVKKTSVSHFRASSSDLKQWRNGAKQFAKFWQEASTLTAPGDFNVEVGAIQALFLGEKPSVSIWKPLVYEHLLLRYGFKQSGRVFYNVDLAKKVIKKYKDIFVWDAGTTDIVKIIRLFESKKNTSSTSIGLILGIPYSATYHFLQIDKLDFQVSKLLKLMPKENNILYTRVKEVGKRSDYDKKLIMYLLNKFRLHRLRLNLLQKDWLELPELSKIAQASIIVNIYGVCWRDSHETKPDSLLVRQRLKAAFEQSGILNVYNHRKYFSA